VRYGWLLVLLASSGCVDLSASYPDRRFYTLEATHPAAEKTPAAGSVLRVRRFTASKACDGNELVTRTGDATYDTDFYNVFFVPPAAQTGEQTQRWLGASKLFGSVVGNGSSLVETHILEGNLVALHGDVRRAAAPEAVIEMQFLLLRVTSDPAAVLFQKTYRQGIPVLDSQPQSMVRGWTSGLTMILTSLEEDLAKLK
jgi:cholesterol transport system auxiliary component